MDPTSASFDKERHVFFLQLMLESLPAEYETQEINSLTLAYFAVSGLAILDARDRVDRDQIASWVLSFQAHPRDKTQLNNGGSTYCTVAALQQMGFIEADILCKSTTSSVINGAITGGCRVGGVLKVLGAYELLDRGALRRFLLSCQSQYGGFTKFPKDMLPELYHSCYGFSALSLLEEPGLNPRLLKLQDSDKVLAVGFVVELGFLFRLLKCYRDKVLAVGRAV